MYINFPANIYSTYCMSDSMSLPQTALPIYKSLSMWLPRNYSYTAEENRLQKQHLHMPAEPYLLRKRLGFP